MNERNQIINFLLESADQKNQIIQQLKEQVASLQKQLAALTPETTPEKP